MIDRVMWWVFGVVFGAILGSWLILSLAQHAARNCDRTLAHRYTLSDSVAAMSGELCAIVRHR